MKLRLPAPPGHILKALPVLSKKQKCLLGMTRRQGDGWLQIWLSTEINSHWRTPGDIKRPGKTLDLERWEADLVEWEALAGVKQYLSKCGVWTRLFEILSGFCSNSAGPIFLLNANWVDLLTFCLWLKDDKMVLAIPSANKFFLLWRTRYWRVWDWYS